MSESADFPRPGASRRRFLAGTGVLGGAAALAACGGATGGGGGGGGEELVGVGNGGQAGSGRAGDGADQLFMAGFQWSPPTNFNTFAGAPAWPASSNVTVFSSAPWSFSMAWMAAATSPGFSRSSNTVQLSLARWP